MRTTVTLDPDVRAAVEHLREERKLGFSEALNDLVRRGAIAPVQHEPFVQRTFPGTFLIDVTNVAEALDYLDRCDEEDARDR